MLTLRSFCGNPVLREVAYPLESTGEPGLNDDHFKVKYAYNRLGELRSMIDQNGTKHTYTRDVLGRVLNDTPAFQAGSGIDTFIKRIAVNYDAFGRLQTVNSYDVITGTPHITNAVEFMYTPLWQVEYLFQDHNSVIERNGTTPIGDTRLVRYIYAPAVPPGSGVSNYSRPASLTYPDGKVLNYTYGAASSADDRISRPSAMGYAGELSAVLNYGRIGLDIFSLVDYTQADVQLDRTLQDDGTRATTTPRTPAGTYPGFDRFGRVVGHGWVDGALGPGAQGLPNRPQILFEKYAYDAASNRTRALEGRPKNLLGNRDREYEYDGLDRLKEARRGVLQGTTVTTGIGSQQWALDMLGNWVRVSRELNGSNPYADPGEAEDRAHNFANEIVTRDPDGSGGQAPLPFAYDHAGNLQSAARSATTNDTYTHDAWNRLVRHGYSGTVIPLETVEYQYNGLHWRTLKKVLSNAINDDTVDKNDAPASSSGTLRLMYYSAAWQLLEERIDLDFANTPGTDQTEQEVWGLRYIDDPVLRRVYTTNPAKDNRYYHLTDVQFSTAAMVGTGLSPRVFERIRYDAYGQATHRWPGDFNDDGYVNSTDQAMLSAVPAGTTINDAAYNVVLDLNHDGVINSADQSAFNLWLNRSPLAVGLISDPAGPDNAFGYGGYVFSPEVSLYCERFRWYDPVTGRWLQRDPAGHVGGMSLFEYAASRPSHFLDPTGLLAEPPKDASGDNKCECSDDELADLRDMLRRRPGDVDHNFAPTKENLEYQRRAAEEFDQNAKRYAAYACEAGLFAATFVVPGDEVLWGAVFYKMGWLTRGGKIVTKEGMEIAENVALKALQEERAALAACKKKIGDKCRKALRKALGKPPKGLKSPQAHHDLPVDFKEWFESRGIKDINAPEHGRWVSGAPDGPHQCWTKQFNEEWRKFIEKNPTASPEEIIKQRDLMRGSGKYPAEWPTNCPAPPQK
jgi:RHS repeat-associated protein